MHCEMILSASAPKSTEPPQSCAGPALGSHYSPMGDNADLTKGSLQDCGVRVSDEEEFTWSSFQSRRTQGTSSCREGEDGANVAEEHAVEGQFMPQVPQKINMDVLPNAPLVRYAASSRGLSSCLRGTCELPGRR